MVVNLGCQLDSIWKQLSDKRGWRGGGGEGTAVRDLLGQVI